MRWDIISSRAYYRCLNLGFFACVGLPFMISFPNMIDVKNDSESLRHTKSQ